MGYGLTMTIEGERYLLSLGAGEVMTLDSVMVGNGILPAGTNPKLLTDLVNPLYYATSNKPAVTYNPTEMQHELRFVIEFRNRIDGLRPDLPLQVVTERFDLTEYGVFVRNSDGERILLMRGNLEDAPEPVIPFDVNKPFILTRRYPVVIVLKEGDVVIKLDYAAALYVTHEELQHELSKLGKPVQPDWLEGDTTSLAHIRNKPDIVDTNDFDDLLGRINNHIGKGGVQQHPLATKNEAGFSEQNFTGEILNDVYNGSWSQLIWGISENDEVVTRTGKITAASGTVVFKTPFDTVPEVFIPQGGTLANITTTGFTFSGSATNRFWVAIADNSD